MDRFETFTVLISKISRNIRKLKSQEMAKYNLKTPHVSCLYYLYKNGNLTAKNLCDICDEDKASISRSIDFLEKNGLLSYEQQEEKKYKSYLYLTEKGKDVAKDLVEKIDSTWVYDSLNISATYDLLECSEEELGNYVNMLRDGYFTGFNVTIPYKKTIMEL